MPASSGKTNRHRLSRGDRRATNAIHTVALVRMSMDPRSKTSPAAAHRTRLRNDERAHVSVGPLSPMS
ncbi:MAG: transposase [Propioniciclava sp.]